MHDARDAEDSRLLDANDHTTLLATYYPVILERCKVLVRGPDWIDVAHATVDRLLSELSRRGATTDKAIVDLEELRQALVEHTPYTDGPELYSRLFEAVGSDAHVRVSRCGREYLEKLTSRVQLRVLACAFPFARANERSRVMCPDFAMAKGARSIEAVDRWLEENRLRSRSTSHWTMKVPPGYPE